MIDHHCHYTGSLSNSWFKKLKPDIDTDELTLPAEDDWRRTYENFFEIYKRRQETYRKMEGKSAGVLYSLGAKDIAQSYIKEGVDQFQIRIGPKIDQKETKERLDGMIEGFEEAEKESNRSSELSKLILTLIQDQSGDFVNTTEESLQETMRLIEGGGRYLNRIIGFDFSGPEDKGVRTKIVPYLKEINRFKKYIYEKSGIRLETMVHLGELVEKEQWEESFGLAEEIIGLDIDRISHGTIFWLNPERWGGKVEIKDKQKGLMKLMAQKEIVLEICPTANLRMTPLGGYDNIPLMTMSELGLKFTVNTDNKAIYQTTLKQEMTAVGLFH